MATGRQVIIIKAASLVIAILTVWWWRSEGFGWWAAGITGIAGYIFSKIALGVALGAYQGTLDHAQIDAEMEAISKGRH
jgi:hypothetical protein